MKVALVGGAGGVGSSAAYNLLLARLAHEVVIVDERAAMVVSHAMDLEQVLELGGGGSLRAGDACDVAEADVVVICASIEEGLATTRMDFLDGNAEVVLEAGEALGAGWPGVAIVVTNPVDPLVTLLQEATGIDRRRVLGYTLNDSLRLRTGVARALGVEPGRVEAWVLGEHGERSVPLLGRVLLDGRAATLSAEQWAEACEFTRGWFARHKALDSGRSSTWTSGLGIARMVGAIAAGSGELFPASVVLEGEYGIEGASVTVPVTLGRRGAERIHEWELLCEESAVLRVAADAVREAARASAARAAPSV